MDFLKQLLTQAQQNPSDDIPIHAMLVQGGVIVAQAGNQKEALQDPTAHAEMLVIREACAKTHSWRLLNTTLYVLVEPCWMCTGAIYAARIPRVVFGAYNPKGGALCFAQKNRVALGLNHSVEVDGGYCEEEIQSLLAGFFSAKRG